MYFYRIQRMYVNSDIFNHRLVPQTKTNVNNMDAGDVTGLRNITFLFLVGADIINNTG